MSMVVKLCLHQCVRIKQNSNKCNDRGDDPGGTSDCEDFVSSPKALISLEKPWQSQERETKSNFNRRKHR